MIPPDQTPLPIEETTSLPSFGTYITALERMAPGRVRAYRGPRQPDDLCAGNAWCVSIPHEGEDWFIQLMPAGKDSPSAWREGAALRMLEAIKQQLDRPIPMAVWPQAVKTAWSLLTGHPCRPMSVGEVAVCLGLSAGYLGERFEQVIGTSFRGVLRDERIAFACRLLEESDLRISEIAAKLGGQSLSQFNRNFASATGISPSSWRRRFYEKRETPQESRDFAEESPIS